MKCNQWTLALIGAGIVSLPAVTNAEEKPIFTSTAVAGTTLSGYVNTSAHFNPGPQEFNTSAYAYGASGSGENVVHKDNGFNLDNVDLTVSKAVDEGQWGAGYKAEIWLGPDANDLGNNSLGINTSDFGVRNAYVELTAPVGTGVDVKMGVWDAPIGYEVGNAPDDVNYTRSYGYTVEPTQQTGVLASYRVNDVLSVSGGIANTTDSKINSRTTNANGTPTKTMFAYDGALTLTAPESMGFLKGGTLSATVIDGRSSTPGATPDVTWLYVGATIPTPLKELSVGACWDQVMIGEGFHDTTVIGGYASYKATDKITVNVRGEYAYWGTGAGSTAASQSTPFAQGDQTLELTTTVDYSLWKNVISRVEFRWDHDLKDAGTMGGGTAGGTPMDNEYLLALNLIYKF